MRVFVCVWSSSLRGRKCTFLHLGVCMCVWVCKGHCVQTEYKCVETCRRALAVTEIIITHVGCFLCYVNKKCVFENESIGWWAFMFPDVDIVLLANCGWNMIIVQQRMLMIWWGSMGIFKKHHTIIMQHANLKKRNLMLQSNRQTTIWHILLRFTIKGM